MEPPSTPPGPSTRASCSGPSAARDERDKTRSPRPPGPGPTGQLVLSIYLWSSFCMYRSHFRLQIKSRDNQPGWTRTLPGRAGSLTARDAGRRVRSGRESTLSIASSSGGSVGAAAGFPPLRGALWEGEMGRSGVFSCGKPRGCLSLPALPSPAASKLPPIFSSAFGPPARLPDLCFLDR